MGVFPPLSHTLLSSSLSSSREGKGRAEGEGGGCQAKEGEETDLIMDETPIYDSDGGKMDFCFFCGLTSSYYVNFTLLPGQMIWTPMHMYDGD